MSFPPDTRGETALERLMEQILTSIPGGQGDRPQRNDWPS
jgi:hypothetical protein